MPHESNDQDKSAASPIPQDQDDELEMAEEDEVFEEVEDLDEETGADEEDEAIEGRRSKCGARGTSLLPLAPFLVVGLFLVMGLLRPILVLLMTEGNGVRHSGERPPSFVDSLSGLGGRTAKTLEVANDIVEPGLS